jgi:hypothetical protein
MKDKLPTEATMKKLNEHDYIAPPEDKCFACGAHLTLGSDWRWAMVYGEETHIVVGPECFRKIVNQTPHPYTTPRGGARLSLSNQPCRCYFCQKQEVA